MPLCPRCKTNERSVTPSGHLNSYCSACLREKGREDYARETPEQRARRIAGQRTYDQTHREEINAGWVRWSKTMTPEQLEREHQRERERQQRLTPAQRLRAANAGRVYGLEFDEWRTLLQQPCEICGQEGPNVIDHHVGGSFDGVLCNRCNVGIGMLRHDPTVLEAATEYVRRTRCESPQPYGRS